MKQLIIIPLLSIFLLSAYGCVAVEETIETEGTVETEERTYDEIGLSPQSEYRFNEMTDWEDEISPEYLFKFKYPQEMRTHSTSSERWGYSIAVYPDEGTSPFSVMVKDPTLITDDSELKELYSKNLEEYLIEVCNVSDLEEIKDTFRGRDAYKILTSDCEGYIEDVDHLRLKRSIFTEYNGLVYELSYMDYASAFNILVSFEFIPEDERPEVLSRDTYEYCFNKFKTQSNIENCLQYTYIEEAACKEFTENMTYKAECYWRLALQEKDQSICENLDEEATEGVNDKETVYAPLDYNVSNCKDAISYTADGVEWNITSVDVEGRISYSGNAIIEGWVDYKTYYGDEGIPVFHVADMTKLPPTIRSSDHFIQMDGVELKQYEHIPAELLEKLKDYDENNMATLSVNGISVGYGTSYLYVVEMVE